MAQIASLCGAWQIGEETGSTPLYGEGSRKESRSLGRDHKVGFRKHRVRLGKEHKIGSGKQSSRLGREGRSGWHSGRVRG